ncbi:hypothetical protein [Streptosporangium sp. NPDC002524]|uniref:hypothetical protein n=1 Tax=Streptosporangium sp. NPDC002524 TaxID=3154537 RepID=UPI00333378D3
MGTWAYLTIASFQGINRSAQSHPPLSCYAAWRPGELVLISAPDQLLRGTSVMLYRDPYWEHATG